MKNTPSQSQGFTLIELTVVIILIIGLSLVVFPAYSNYVKRTKVTEGLALASTAKLAVTHYATNNIPLTSVWTPPKETDVVKDINIYLTDTTGISLSSRGEPRTNLPAHHSGEIVIVFSPNIASTAHNELVLSPRQADPTRLSSNGHELPIDLTQHYLLDQPIVWECNSASPPEVNRGTRGSLNKKLAPAHCRA